MICQKCGTEMSFCWDGNPDGPVAHECPKCGGYHYEGVFYTSYAAANNAVSVSAEALDCLR